MFAQRLQESFAVGETLIKGRRRGFREERHTPHGDGPQAMSGAQISSGSDEFSF